MSGSTLNELEVQILVSMRSIIFSTCIHVLFFTGSELLINPGTYRY